MLGNERVEWMDLLRGAAVIFVALFHAAGLPPVLFAISIPGSVLLATRALEPWLPLLLAVSGILLPHALTRPLPTYYSGKLRRIGLPFFLWTVITVWAFSPSLLWTDPTIWYRGFIHTWFLSTLMICFLLAPVLSRVPWLFVAACFMAVWFMTGPVFPGGERVWYFGAFFFLGAALASRLDRLAALPGWIVTGLAMVVALGVAAAVTGPAGYALRPHWAVVSTAGVLLALWAAPRFPTRGPVTRIVTAAGRNALPIYVVHVPAMLLLARGWEWLHLPGGWVAYLAFVIAGLGAPLALAQISALGWRRGESALEKREASLAP